MKQWQQTRRWNMKDAMAMDNLQIQWMSLEERADLAQYLHKQYMRRLAEADKAGVIPYGIKKLQHEYGERYAEIVDIDGTKMTVGEYLGIDLEKNVTRRVNGRNTLAEPYASMPYANNTLYGYIRQLQDFFSWKSSSVAGWRKITEAQDRRLFGTHKEQITLSNGKVINRTVANAHFTDEQRERFWRAIEEAKRRSSNALTSFDSDPLVEGNWVELLYTKDGAGNYVMRGDINWNDPTELLLAVEKVLNGESLETDFDEEAPGVESGSAGSPFGQARGEGEGGTGLEYDSL